MLRLFREHICLDQCPKTNGLLFIWDYLFWHFAVKVIHRILETSWKLVRFLKEQNCRQLFFLLAEAVHMVFNNRTRFGSRA